MTWLFEVDVHSERLSDDRGSHVLKCADSSSHWSRTCQWDIWVGTPELWFPVPGRGRCPCLTLFPDFSLPSKKVSLDSYLPTSVEDPSFIVTLFVSGGEGSPLLRLVWVGSRGSFKWGRDPFAGSRGVVLYEVRRRRVPAGFHWCASVVTSPYFTQRKVLSHWYNCKLS